jgi:hypothetical protein
MRSLLILALFLSLLAGRVFLIGLFCLVLLLRSR